MLHDIADKEYHCEYTPREPDRENDYILAYDNEKILLRHDGNAVALPRVCEAVYRQPEKLQYLISVSGRAIFLAGERIAESDVDRYESVRMLRNVQPKWLAFAAVTGYHLAYWYSHNRFCGTCGARLEHMDTERGLRCPACGNIRYPDMAVAIIVGVINGDSILMTKYAVGEHRNYALVAGFYEIGETLEGTVRREVMEETGLRVKNIRYFDNQPWGFSRSMLAGFFAELDGSPDITMDPGELSEACWVRRADIESVDDGISLTSKMIDAFRTGRIVKPGMCSAEL